MSGTQQVNLSEEVQQATRAVLEHVVEKLSGRVYSPRIKLLTIDQVCEATSLGQTTIYEMIKAGRFPKPQEKVGSKGKNLWRESALIAWCDANDPNR